MKKLDKFGIGELQSMVAYILENRNNRTGLINAFGKVTLNNGEGTDFLAPADPIFKLVWVNGKDNKVEAVGLGGPAWSLKLSDLLTIYKQHTEGFSRYDDAYIYVFFPGEAYSHSIQIFSKDRLFDGDKLLHDTAVYQMDIYLK